jgi:hypothetical protein
MGGRDSHGIIVLSESLVDYANLEPLRGKPYRSRYQYREWLAFLPSRVFRGRGKGYIPRWPENLNVEAGFSFHVVALHIGLNPIELVDLLTGFFLIDIARDDVRFGTPALGDMPTVDEYMLFTPPPDRTEEPDEAVR